MDPHSVPDCLYRDRAYGGKGALERVQEICDALGLEFQIGVPEKQLRRKTGRDWRGFAEDQLMIEGRKEALALGYEPIPFLEEAGSTEDLSPIAFSRDWIEQRGLDHDHLKMALVPLGQGMGPYAVGDRIVIDTRRPVDIDGRIFAYFNSLIGGLQIAHLLKVADQRVVAVTHLAERIEQVVLKPGHKIVGPIVFGLTSPLG